MPAPGGLAVSTFDYEPSPWVPFRDRAAIAACRAIPRAAIERHANPEFRIRVVPDVDLRLLWLADIYARLRDTAVAGRSCALLLPNPVPTYRMLAQWINRTRLDCRHAWFIAMDEYADQDGRVAPTDWPRGFGYALLRFLWSEIDEALRPPREQVVIPGNDNLEHFDEVIDRAGGLECSYTGPGWTGHLAFIEPDAPEFVGVDGQRPFDEWVKLGARVVTLSPFTLAQNSLHGSMGFSGDLSAVPPKAATVGPRHIVDARHRWEMAGIGVAGTATSWQRLAVRLCYHGPVTPRLPSSLHQTLRTDCYLTENVAADIHDTWDRGY